MTSTDPLFITVTANPGWPEVKASLLPHQTAAEREDLILWVFHLKLRDLLTDLKDRIARHGPQ